MSRGTLFGAGGRFADASTDPVFENNESINFDKRMWSQDIDGSIAYAKALSRGPQHIITPEESSQLVEGLLKVRKEWEEGNFVIKHGDEDIHTANERRLTEIVGSVGGKLHTGRSRNDQVATDTRLWLRDAEDHLSVLLKECIQAGCNLASDNVDSLMAGYTHLQPAMPIRFSHWLMSHIVPLTRDLERLSEMRRRCATSPLGSGALAGNSFEIDREFLAQELGFEGGLTLNSLDATCDRDFVVEFLMWHTLLLTHISQFAEDVIIFNYSKAVVISEAYSTGSSLMPQKKNPDALELLRGKAGMALGRCVGFTATLKGLPRAYNKDLQEDKIGLFESVDSVEDCVQILTGILMTMKTNEEGLKAGLCKEMLATDLADYLVRKGVPFRETHHISGAAVRFAEEKKMNFGDLTLEQLQAIDKRFEPDVMKIWDYESSVERKNVVGGTAKVAVQRTISACRKLCE